MSAPDRDWIAQYIVDNCLVETGNSQPLYGKLPGSRYKSQFYLATLLYDQRALETVGNSFRHLVESEIGHWNFQLAGRLWSASPLLVFLPAYMRRYGVELNAFVVRRERKTYGMHNYIEGKPNKSQCLLVDDLCNSTDSFRHSSLVCSNEQGLQTLPYIFAVLNKGYVDTDKYLDHPHRALSCCDRSDIDKIRQLRRSEREQSEQGLRGRSAFVHRGSRKERLASQDAG
jgi:orotate phosphoribosyltransferase